MGRRQSPSEPRKHERPDYAVGTFRGNEQWHIMQNIFRMWRDFPELRFGKFIEEAISFSRESMRQTGRARWDAPGLTRAPLYMVRDEVLEQVCYRFWVHKSGRRVPSKVRERWS